jgi:ubiquinone/menaquinone biosynthesis C-methylase UbiE
MDSQSQEREAFSSLMTDILNKGALNLALGIGYRTGLFEVMDELGRPATAKEIARKSLLDQRYLDEWLGIMSTGKVIRASRSGSGELLYLLPKAHGDFLTRRSGNDNLGVYTQEIPLLSQASLDGVLHGFKTGAGIGYDSYRDFQAFMSELADAKHRQVLVQTFLPSVAGGEIVARLQRGASVCDLCCGEGVAVLLMARKFLDSKFVGLDFSMEAIEKARSEALRVGLTNAEFHCVDAGDLSSSEELHEQFDYVTAFDSIHDQTRPRTALETVLHLLKPGGFFSMVDIAASSDLLRNLEHPMGPFLYTVSLMHCMPVGRVDGGTGLGMMWGREKAVEMLSAAGFSEVQVAPVAEDPFNDHFLCRKPG